MKKILMAGAALSVLAVSNVWATCGDVEATSTDCTTQATLSVPDRVIVSGLSDIGTLSYTPGSAATGSTTFCIGTNVAAGVQVTFGSSASSGYGMVGDTSGEDLPYTLTFTAGSTDVSPAEGTQSVAFTDGVDDLSCANNATSMEIDISVADADITSAGDTDFTEDLTLTVEPG